MKTALISVYDKSGLKEFAFRLKKLNFKIISTGNTAKFLNESGVGVEEVSHYTGFPEILDGRVKTLHPKIHAGILARRNHTLPLTPSPRGRGKGEGDIETLNKLGIDPIDLVVVNLYPFESTPTIENIDIGGPTLLRAAAKNFESVTVVCDPSDYERVGAALEKGETPVEMRRELAGKVFGLMAKYEAAIAEFFGSRTTDNGQRTTDQLRGKEVRGPWSVVRSPSPSVHPLRYGENPHQLGIFAQESAEALLWNPPLQGKELSYNNILDADAAWWLIQEFKKEPFACAIIKHTNPCGVAVSKKSLSDAFAKAFACDSQSAFGGIVVFNCEVDGKIAEALAKIFLEVILAPAFSKEALKILATKKNLRLLEMRETAGPQQLLRSAGGGLLLQDPDRMMDEEPRWEIKTKRKPTSVEMEALQFAWKIVKHVKSNAIVFTDNNQTLGIGAGQVSRIDAVKVAMMKAQKNLKGSIVASDAFFPFADNIESIAKSGATAIIQPGGSLKDSEVIAAADQHKLAMVFTGVRHFRH